MSKKYESLALEILQKVGGSENVSVLTHCMTRLRFVLNNTSNVDRKGIEGLNGVINVIESGGQFQVVIGPHVEEVYEEVIKHVKPSENTGGDPSKGEKVGPLNKLIDFVSAAFGPLIPAIAGAGMIRALLALLLMFNVITRTSQTYYVVNFMADAVFYFLPVLLAYSAANKLKTSPVLAMALAGVLLHPNLTQLRTAGEAVHIFGIPMKLVNYGSSVIPILLIVVAQSYIERMVKKVVPDAIKIIFVPMITIFITAIIGLTILGPIGSIIGDYMAIGFKFLEAHGAWLVIFLVGTFWPILVMFGIHYSLSPLSTAQLATLGIENIIGPGAILANITQGVVALVVGLRTKDPTLKQVATTSGITGLMGITEPALYGVNLPKKYPLISAMIGSACGALYAGINHVSRYAVGASGIPAIPLYIGPDIWNLYNILIALVIAVVVSATLTYFLSFKYEKDIPKQNKNSEKKEDSKKKTDKDVVITSPIKGAVVKLRDVKDDAFASEAMGKGIAIEPSEGKVVAPFNGEVVSLFPTKHAIGLLSDDGIEMLIHVGVNTVELNGKHFDAHVKQGEKVSKGQTLLTFDFKKIQEEGYITQVPIIITNTQDYSDVISNCNGNVDYNNELLVLKA
ncbi:MAG: beta-glucoside-specific PTS transporter subunit IIABC [Clostridiaceae bacterium]